ncbi:aminoacyl-histidine dipeptidase [Nitzschia inconspicua]|uniref:Aminoacyl-histidine dipeptidase n=1 Tax=Nitzschia inconspicua TaxID=303405 RepID=A0A9K3M1I6_9STRA|nr:aminoacyl-histidine dipeptidase [Nitzschia inconspicua]
MMLHPAAANISVPPDNLQAIRGLEPSSVWSQFAILSSIPRPSKQEDAILQYIKDFAAHHNLSWKQDKVGNLALFYPGTVPDAPPVILQGHVDMVTEKNSGTDHDFDKDPIRFEPNLVNGSWLTAQGTTLGADNGIGVAAILALLSTPTDDKTVMLPPLEALFTVDEETGLTGAFALDASALQLKGKTMLNLDTEEWTELYVGCAGGGESFLTLTLEREAATESEGKLVELRVDGLLGGHSGINIHEGRGNAVLLCAAATQAVLKQLDGVVKLVSLSGGDKHNAIAREAKAVLFLSNPDAENAVKEIVEKQQEAAKAEFGVLEKNLRVVLLDSTEQNCGMPLTKTSSEKLLSMMLSLPHGAIKFSHAILDLVETSNNVASLTMSDGDKAVVLCSTRSSINTALESARDKLAAVATLAGATIERAPYYPGWNPNMDSEILKIAEDILAGKIGRSPGVKAIHAGLECGMLIEKLGGGVDALSFGPTITGAHSPDESINVETVPPFFDLVQEILAQLAQKK